MKTQADKDPSMPSIGQKVYVPTQLFLSRGEDDFQGGIATVSRVESDSDRIMVTIEERHYACRYNWAYLQKHQEEWSKAYGSRIAHQIPDNQIEFNKWN